MIAWIDLSCMMLNCKIYIIVFREVFERKKSVENSTRKNLLDKSMFFFLMKLNYDLSHS